MTEGWRWEPVVSLVCTAFLPAWVYFTGHNTQRTGLVVLGVVLGVGIGCGAAGVRRGRWASRVLSGVCLVVLLVVAIGFIIWMRWVT